MTAEFVPQATIGSGFDYTTAGTQPAEKGVAQAKPNTLRLYDLETDPKDIGRGEIVINDFSLQGYNHPEGDFSQNANGFAWSEMNTNRPGELTPTVNTDLTQDTSISGNLVGAHSAYAFGTQFFGIGSAANHSLYKEFSTSNSTPTAITWSPGASICSMTQSLTSGAERLVVGRVGAAAVKFSDATGTVGETMHADTNSMWGMIVSGVNATTAGVPVQLIYSGTTIKTKATDADQTTALVATNPATSVNAGGFAIGAVKPGGRAQRAYWGIPKVSNTSGALKFGAEAMCDIMSTDMTGADLLPHQSFFCPQGILECKPFRDGLLYHDGRVVVYWDGDKEWNLGIFRRRVKAGQTTNVIDSDDRRRVRQLFINGPECGVVWQWFDMNATVVGTSYFEIYNFESGTWHNVAQKVALTATGATPDIVLGCGSNSISPNTHKFYSFQSTGTYIRHCFIPLPGESPLWQNSLGSGGTFTTDIPNYGGGNLLGCDWWLDEFFPSALRGTSSIKRMPKVITDVEFGGNFDYGGAGIWSLRVRIQGRGVDGTTVLLAYDQTFGQGKPSADYKKRNPPRARANILDVQVYLTSSNLTSTQNVVQLLPFTIRFAYSKVDQPITELPEDNVRR